MRKKSKTEFQGIDEIRKESDMYRWMRRLFMEMLDSDEPSICETLIKKYIEENGDPMNYMHFDEMICYCMTETEINEQKRKEFTN